VRVFCVCTTANEMSPLWMYQNGMESSLSDVRERVFVDVREKLMEGVAVQSHLPKPAIGVFCALYLSLLLSLFYLWGCWTRRGHKLTEVGRRDFHAAT
jgi:hypothetical protein